MYGVHSFLLSLFALGDVLSLHPTLSDTLKVGCSTSAGRVLWPSLFSAVLEDSTLGLALFSVLDSFFLNVGLSLSTLWL